MYDDSKWTGTTQIRFQDNWETTEKLYTVDEIKAVFINDFNHRKKV